MLHIDRSQRLCARATNRESADDCIFLMRPRISCAGEYFRATRTNKVFRNCVECIRNCGRTFRADAEGTPTGYPAGTRPIREGEREGTPMEPPVNSLRSSTLAHQARFSRLDILPLPRSLPPLVHRSMRRKLGSLHLFPQ